MVVRRWKWSVEELKKIEHYGKAVRYSLARREGGVRWKKRVIGMKRKAEAALVFIVHPASPAWWCRLSPRPKRHRLCRCTRVGAFQPHGFEISRLNTVADRGVEHRPMA